MGPSPPTAPATWAPAGEPAGLTTGMRPPGPRSKPPRLPRAHGDPQRAALAPARPLLQHLPSERVSAACTCFSGGPQSLPWAAFHSRAMSAYFSFSSSLSSLGRSEGETGREAAVRSRPGRPARRAGVWMDSAAVPASVCPGRAQGALSPSSRGQGAAGLRAVSVPPGHPAAQPRSRPRPYRPVGRAVGDGIRHARHGQASPPQLGDLLLHEEIVGIPAGLAVRHGQRGPASSGRNTTSHRRPRRAPALSNRGGPCARSPAPLSQSGSSAQPRWPHWKKTCPRRQDPSACGCEGGAWPWVQSILIGWDEAGAGALSRGRHRAPSGHYCVIRVKVGGERRAGECVSSSIVLCNCEQYWVGDRVRNCTNKVFFLKKFTV